MTVTPPTGLQPSQAERLRLARLLTCRERRGMVTAFFTGVDPHGPDGLGLGTAIADFQEWEITSGRIRDGGGSPWWSAMNGLLLLDMADSCPGSTCTDDPVRLTHGTGRHTAGWDEFLRSASVGSPRAQRALWSAHQDSICRAAEICSGLLDSEPEHEQKFALLALAVVDNAAQIDVPTDGPTLGQMTRSYFPADYPIGGQALAELRTELAELR